MVSAFHGASRTRGCDEQRSAGGALGRKSRQIVGGAASLMKSQV